MSTIFKRFAAGLLVLVMALSVAACKNNKETDAEKVMNTQAVRVGNHTLSAAILNYFYVDAISDWVAQYGGLALNMGLDVTKPLNQQVINSATGETWADSFVTVAQENIQSTYALYDLAMAENFTLSQSEQAALDATVEELEAVIEYYKEYYASAGYTYPYAGVTEYLEVAYGVGATPENYMEYCRVRAIADAYYKHYVDSLEYTTKELREYESDKYVRYCSYSFTVYYLPVSSFDSVDDAEAAARALASVRYADKVAFDEAIKALSINADVENPALSESYENVLYGQIADDYVEWLAEEGRLAGDMGVAVREIPDGEGTVVKGYYVVRFDGMTDNKFLMKNVRHILVAFQGGTTNSSTGVTTYSDEEKNAARKKAEQWLFQFRTGSMTELRFADMANAYSDDGNGTTGGLYADLYPGLVEPEVEAWSYDPARNVGDTGLVEAKDGWYIMYFVGNTTYTFREYMLTNDKKVEDVSAWYDALVKSTKVEILDTTYVDKDMVLSK